MGLLDTADLLIDQIQSGYDAGKYLGDATAQRVGRVASIFKGDNLSNAYANPVQDFQEPVPGFNTQFLPAPSPRPGGTNTLLIVAVVVVAVMLLGD
jgi:hypothetical protein